MKKGRAVLERGEAEAVQRVLDHLWDDERRDHEAAPAEGHIFRDLETAARALERGWARKGESERRIDGGRLVVTPGVRGRVHPAEVHRALGRHLSGDWGEVCEDDRAANEEALREGARLFSVYEVQGGERFWVITEADRSSTCVLLPEEY